MAPRERFGRIGEISIEDAGTWHGRVFITLDIDWADDAVICFAADLLEAAGVAATWFVTHQTPVLERLRANPKFELGIHPNFNFLLAGDPRNGTTSEEVLERLFEVVPEAKAVRSHSMTQSSVLLNQFAAHGLTHDCNHYIPHHAGLDLKPWALWNGLTKVPYAWEDDFHCLRPGASPFEIASGPGLCVLDFHPIHLFLNTDDLSRYEGARPFLDDCDRLTAYRCAGHGIARLLDDLLECG